MKITTPGAELRAVYGTYIAAARLLWDLRRDHAAWSDICKADVAMTVAVNKFHALKAATREAFAKSRGWRYDRKRYLHLAEYGIYGRRIIKNPEFFRDSEGTHVGLITHTAATQEECASFAARYGYNAEVLPYSWDAPNYHTAVLFTLKAGPTWPT